jgi:hypothetical protein
MNIFTTSSTNVSAIAADTLKRKHELETKISQMIDNQVR